MFFWVTVVGGLLLALSALYDPHRLPAIVGLVLFVVGVILFFSRSLADARREGVGLGRAAARAGKRALRFAWSMMP
jgi:uncharacterized membrane protein YfcA